VAGARNESASSQALRVAQALLDILGPQAENFPGIHERVAEVVHEEFARQVLAVDKLAQTTRRLQFMLDAENSPMRIDRIDLAESRVYWSCTAHPDRGIRGIYLGAAFAGQRCKSCAGEKTGERCRMTEVKLTEAASVLGVRLQSPFSAYRKNTTRLQWVCARCSTIFDATWIALKDRRTRCPSCAESELRQDLRATQWPRLLVQIAANGDVMESVSSEYRNQATRLTVRCTRHGGCGEIFTMSAEKILRGQLHSCDRYRRFSSARWDSLPHPSVEARLPR